MTDAITRKLALYAPLAREDVSALHRAVSRTINIAADEDIVAEGEQPSVCQVLLEGFACRYKLLPEGRRQITGFVIPGDFCNLDGFIAGRMDLSVGTLTPCTVALIPGTAMTTLLASHPGLQRALWRDTILEGNIAREWVVNVGRRSAKHRVAHVLCEVLKRLQAVGLAREDGFEWPLTQSEFSDVTGLSTVHVNRVLRELHRDGVVTVRDRYAIVHDWGKLRQTAGFDPNYLTAAASIP